jgi:hypothetical protein
VSSIRSKHECARCSVKPMQRCTKSFVKLKDGCVWSWSFVNLKDRVCQKFCSFEGLGVPEVLFI